MENPKMIKIVLLAGVEIQIRKVDGEFERRYLNEDLPEFLRRWIPATESYLEENSKINADLAKWLKQEGFKFVKR
jgi:hypothetical protein